MFSIEQIIHHMYYNMTKLEKMAQLPPENMEPIHEEIFRSLQATEQKTSPTKMSKEATLEFMRIINDMDRQKFNQDLIKDIVIDDELLLVMKLVKMVESGDLTLNYKD